MFFLFGLLFSSATQEMKIEFDAPIFYNIKILPLNLQPGLVAEYEVTRGDLEYLHTVTVKRKYIMNGETLIDLSFSSDLPQKVTMEMTVLAETPDLINSKNIKLILPYGEFKIQTLSGGLEQSLERVTPESLVIMGNMVPSTKLEFLDGAGAEGLVWVSEKWGPLGIGKVKRLRDGVTTTYILKNVKTL